MRTLRRRAARRRKVKLERLKRRGKSPPKKGEGKRAGKR
jgi:small subunit ribosomal protein S33